MKKIVTKGFALLTVVAVVLSLAACNSKHKKAETSSSETTGTQTSSEETQTVPSTEPATAGQTETGKTTAKTMTAEAPKNTAEALKLYKDAANKTKAQKNMTMTRTDNTASIAFGTVKLGASGKSIDDGLKNKISDFADKQLYPRVSSYTYKLNNGTYSMERRCSDGNSYYEYCQGSKFSWKNSGLLKSISNNVKGLSKSEANAKLNKAGTGVSTPDQFIPMSGYSEHCLITANDVKSFTASKQGNNIAVKLVIKECKDAQVHKSGTVGMCMNPLDLSAVKNISIPGGGVKSVTCSYYNISIDAVVSPDGLIVSETMHYDLKAAMEGKFIVEVGGDATSAYTETINYSNYGKTAVSKPSWA